MGWGGWVNYLQRSMIFMCIYIYICMDVWMDGCMDGWVYLEFVATSTALLPVSPSAIEPLSPRALKPLGLRALTSSDPQAFRQGARDKRH